MHRIIFFPEKNKKMCAYPTYIFRPVTRNTLIFFIWSNCCIDGLCYIKVELHDRESTLVTDIISTVLVLAGMTIFCSSCRVVAKQIHGNSCIDELCYIEVELNE